MSELKRYWIGNDEGTGFPVSEDEEGEWVKASDAEQALLAQKAALKEKDAEIARLRMALEEIQKSCAHADGFPDSNCPVCLADLALEVRDANNPR